MVKCYLKSLSVQRGVLPIAVIKSKLRLKAGHSTDVKRRVKIPYPNSEEKMEGNHKSP